ncbi:hypothetical protein M3Y98_00870900 [Aphelenchoides besseyi]|nr:hypothetical protein M3Y98_00870900 [Aphelenchoides besseyi]KAI6211286.1 hypothetical protein M3Y96_00417400 [Aphelenchoides besseyi]
MSEIQEVPEKFFGSFKLEKSEKFDEYLSKRGVNWFLRKMIQLSSITKIISKGTTPNTYNFENVAPKMNLKYNDWKLGEEFEAKGFDGDMHKIMFRMADPDTLTERHIRLNMTGDAGETYAYTIENDYLVLTMTQGDVKCRRFLKRQ